MYLFGGGCWLRSYAHTVVEDMRGSLCSFLQFFYKPKTSPKNKAYYKKTTGGRNEIYAAGWDIVCHKIIKKTPVNQQILHRSTLTFSEYNL